MNKCGFKTCEKESVVKGCCKTHYTKLRRTGTLDPIRGTPRGNKINSDSQMSELSKIDPTPDPKHRGYLAVNKVNDIKYKAIQRGKVWNLTNIEAYKLIIAECNYCGFKPNWPETRVGIDRVNNEIGYEVANCVSCCFTCNSAKKELSTEEFVAWIKRVYSKIT